MNVIKRAQNVQFWTERLRRYKIRTEKRLRKVTDPQMRNYMESGFGRKHVRESYAKSKRISGEEDLIPLSEGLSVDHRYPVLNFEKESFNKEMKKALKKRLEEDGKQTMLVEREGLSLMMSPKADQINRITSEEWDKYKRVFYEKNEIKRLIAKKDKDTEEILALGATYDGSIGFMTNILGVVKEGSIHGPAKGQGNTHSVQLHQHQSYKKDMQAMKNDKIDGIIGLHSANDKLKELMECGFMDKSKTIEQVFTTLQRSNLQRALQNNSEVLANSVSNDISPAVQKLLPQTTMPEEDRKAMWKEFSTLLANDPARASAMELVVTAVEKEGLQGTYSSDYLGLVDFVKDFVELDPKEKSEVYERMKGIKEIRRYEESLLEHREDNMLERRGTPLFSKLKSEEMIPYIKHNTHYMQDIFKIVNQNEGLVREYPEVAVAMVEKLALGYTLGPLLYKNTKFIDLQTIAQKEYHTLLKILKEALPTLSFESLARTVFVLGRLHHREAGELIGDLFNTTARVAVISFSAKLQKLEEIIDSATEDNKISVELGTMMYNLGIGLQGLLAMGCINKSTPASFIDQILYILDNKSLIISEGCTLNRVISTVNQVVSAYGVSYDENAVSILNKTLKVAATELIPQMGRIDLLDLVTNLVATYGLDIHPDPKFLLPALESLKLNILSEDNLSHLTLNNLDQVLMLFVATNTLDIKSKNLLKKRISDQLAISSNIMSYVLPQTMESLAISDLKDSNDFYAEYSSPGELLLIRGLFGIRPFEYDNTPKFSLYKDIYKLVMSEVDVVKKSDIIKVIDGLCAVEVPLEVFQYSILDKTIEEMLEKDIKAGKPYDSKLASRVALLFSNMGIYNLRDKWVKLCFAHYMQGAYFRPDSILDLLCCADNEIVQHYDKALLKQMVAQLMDKQQQISSTKKAILAWNIFRLDIDSIQGETVSDLCENIEQTSLKTMDLLLLSQVPQASDIINSIPKQKLIDLYKSIHHKVSPALTNDTASIYAALKSDLQRTNQPFKETQWITHDDSNAYAHLYLIKMKTAVAIYPNDLFLTELNLSQNAHYGYDYSISRTEKLPFFFEENEASLIAMGIKCTRLPASSAREAFIEAGLEQRLRNDEDGSSMKYKIDQNETNQASSTKFGDIRSTRRNSSAAKSPRNLKSSQKSGTTLNS